MIGQQTDNHELLHQMFAIYVGMFNSKAFRLTRAILQNQKRTIIGTVWSTQPEIARLCWNDSHQSKRMADTYDRTGSTQNRVSDRLLLLGSTQEALDGYAKATEIMQRLVDADPENRGAQRDLFISYMKLGLLYEQTGNHGKALAEAAQG